MTIDKDDFPENRVIAALILLFSLRLVFAAQIDLIEDEAYYRLWGLYPSYAYYDHAPMVGWWIAIGQALWGDNEFGLRFLSPVAAFVGSFFVWRIAQLSFNRSVANHAVLIFNAMPMIGLGSILMTPDVPSVFFWGLAIWTLVEWNRTNRNLWWILFGLAAGLGLLSKYSNIFLGAGVLIWLAASGRWHQAVRTPHFYIAGLIALLLFSPVMYWNAIHDWASFSKQFGRLQLHEFTLRFLGEWVGGQALLISPIIFGFFVASLISKKRLMLRQNINAQLVILSFVPMLIYFLVHALSSRINANWTVPLFSSFAMLAALSLYDARQNRNSISSKMAIFAAPIGFVMTLFVLIEALFPILPPSNKNPISQIRGYQELATQIRAIAKTQNVDTLLTTSYQTTSLLSFHLKDITVIQPTERVRYLNLPNPDEDRFEKPALIIMKAAEASAALESLRPCVRNAKRIQDIQRTDRGAVLANFELWMIDSIDPAIFKRGNIEDCKVEF